MESSEQPRQEGADGGLPPSRSGERTAKSPSPGLPALTAVVIAAAIAVALYFARPVVVPLVFALVLAMLIQPVVARLRRRLPHWLSLTLALLGLALVLTSAGWLFASGVASIVAKAPQYGQRFNEIVANLRQFAGSHGIVLSGRQVNFQNALVQVVTFLGSSLGSVIGLLTDILLVLLLMTFALAEAEQFRDRLFRALGTDRSRRFLRLIDPLTVSVQRYLLAKTVICLITGAGTYAACLLLGVDFAFVWGVLAFLLHYVPYFGPALALIPPVALAFIQYPQPGRGLILLIVLGALFGASGYIAEPRIMGWSLRLSPLFVLYSLIFWGWFWGLSGVVLSVPLSSALVIGFSYIPRLRPLAVLLGAEPIKADEDMSATDKRR